MWIYNPECRYDLREVPLYDKVYLSIGCEPCTSLLSDLNDQRSGRWAGRKVECGIHIQADPAQQWPDRSFVPVV